MRSKESAPVPAAGNLVDHIAKGLPDDIRAEYYRVMMRCRDLPENDEMLCILNALRMLTLLTVQVPDRVVTEREKFEKLFTDTVASHEKLLRTSTTYQQHLDARIRDLPETILKEVNPKALSARINESLEQHFIRSELPRIARALDEIAGEMKRTAGKFKSTADTLSSDYRTATADAKRSISEMKSAVEHGACAARSAATELEEAFESQHRWIVWLLLGLVFLAGLGLGVFLSRQLI